MRHIWFDITAGVSGDMLMAAMIDAGAPVPALQEAIDAVVPGAVRLGATTTHRAGQRAARLTVEVLAEDPPHRTWREIRQMLAEARLPTETRTRATAVFQRLAEAEGRAHGIPPEEIHFHEVGALDSIADVVGACEAVRQLGAESFSASPVALGSGRVQIAHGDIGVPVPAVAELAIGWATVEVSNDPATGSGPNTQDDHSHGRDHSRSHDEPAPMATRWGVGELATPTGLALIRSLAGQCESLPAMQLEAVGVGAGSRDTPGRPNVVRALIGELSPSPRTSPATDTTIEVMTNVDDLDPRLWPGVIDAILAVGALDAWLVPIQMKKGRPAFTLHALVTGSHRDLVVQTILRHTSTLGVREVSCSRTTLDRSWQELEVLGKSLQVKVGSVGHLVLHAAAEYASMSEIARETGTSEYQVAQHAAAAIVAAGLARGNGLP